MTALSKKGDSLIRNAIFLVGGLAGALLSPATGYADSARRAGENVGAAAGAIIGGAAGLAGSIVDGITGADEPRSREYVEREHGPSYRYDRDVTVGVQLPPTLEYYDVPSEYHVRHSKYAVINDHTVLVDRVTHQIVEVID